MDVPTSNVLTRVLLTRSGSKQFTSFTLSLDGRVYIISTEHGVNINEGLQFCLGDEAEWVQVNAQFLLSSPKEIYDFIVYVLLQDDEFLQFPIMDQGYCLGQSAFFAGYPDVPDIPRMHNPDNQMPVPVLRKGVIAAWGGGRIVLDARNLYGFSGSPVVVKPPKSEYWHVIGIVTHFLTSRETVGVTQPHSEFEMFVNSGFTLCTDISKVVEAIRKGTSIGSD
ncbi:MAG: hypothetical protein KTV68_15930 [Acidimicrobiia bacterium]|nr:hypothetical protein [Acidimicrobiia bacterium]